MNDFLKDHPFVAGGSFLVGGAVGYGVSHKFLDFEPPYAIGAGVVVGAATVLVESYIYSWLSLKPLEKISEPVVQAVKPVMDWIDKDELKRGRGYLEDLKDELGRDPTMKELSDYTLKRLTLDKEKKKEQLIALSEGITGAKQPESQKAPTNDAVFTTNAENPPTVLEAHFESAVMTVDEAVAQPVVNAVKPVLDWIDGDSLSRGKQIVADFEADNGRKPTLKEIADALNKTGGRAASAASNKKIRVA